MIVFSKRPDSNGDIALSSIDVAYDYKGYRLGSQLMSYAIKNGVNTLLVQKDHDTAIKLYKDNGFVITNQNDVDNGNTNSYRMYSKT